MAFIWTKRRKLLIFCLKTFTWFTKLAFWFSTQVLMSLQVFKFHCFCTFYTLNIKLIVYINESSSTHILYRIGTAFIGTGPNLNINVPIFLDVIVDAKGAEQVTASSTFLWQFYNVMANNAIKYLALEVREPVLLVAKLGHFCWLSWLYNENYKLLPKV